MLRIEDVNPDKDRLFDDQEIVVISNHTDSIHRVKTYVVYGGEHDGKLYHVFYYITGNAVIHYNDSEYIQLSRYFNVCDEDAEIFFVDPSGIISKVDKQWRLAVCVR